MLKIHYLIIILTKKKVTMEACQGNKSFQKLRNRRKVSSNTSASLILTVPRGTQIVDMGKFSF